MTLLARLVLAGFLLSLGVAAASPAVKPQALEMVCSGGSYKLVSPQEGTFSGAASVLDCPLCVLSGLPPVAPAFAARGTWGAESLPQGGDALVATAFQSGPPPARAPPAVLSSL